MPDPIHLSPPNGWLPSWCIGWGNRLTLLATLGSMAANAWSQTNPPTPQPASAPVGLAIALKKEEPPV